MTATPVIPALTGARLLACLLIVFDHGMLITPFSDPDLAWQRYTGINIGFFGMSLFFVLSGFVIYLNYAPQFRDRPFGEACASFAVARFARLYPLYAFFMALVLASIVPARIPPMFPDLYWWIPMMQSWVLGSGKAPVLLAVEEAALTWSLSTEVFFYAVFPFLCLLVFRRMKWRTYVRLEVPLLAVVSVVVVLLLYVLWPVVLKLQPQMSWLHVTWWWGYQSPYAQIFAFLSGVAIA